MDAKKISAVAAAALLAATQPPQPVKREANRSAASSRTRVLPLFSRLLWLGSRGRYPLGLFAIGTLAERRRGPTTAGDTLTPITRGATAGPTTAGDILTPITAGATVGPITGRMRTTAGLITTVTAAHSFVATMAARSMATIATAIMATMAAHSIAVTAMPAHTTGIMALGAAGIMPAITAVAFPRGEA
jgi:hypothetical protein